MRQGDDHSHSSADSGHDQRPRRSSSGRSKKSFVASLTNAMSITSTTSSATQSLSTLSLSSTEQHTTPAVDLSSPDEITDPALFRPVQGYVRPSVVWKHYTMRGWLTRHIPPSYSFTKSKKTRYVILADRMIYTFKTDKPTPHYREFLELTKDTDVFVTDYFSGVLYCIEICKHDGESKSWYLQCEDAESMKVWLDRLKKTVHWLRAGHPGVVTLSAISRIQSDHDALVNSTHADNNTASPPCGRLSSSGASASESSSVDTRRMSARTTMPATPDQQASNAYPGTPSIPTCGEWDDTLAPLSPLEKSHSPPLSPTSPTSYSDSAYSYYTQPPPIRRVSAPSHSIRIVPPQRPPPRTAPPPPPRSMSTHMEF